MVKYGNNSYRISNSQTVAMTWKIKPLTKTLWKHNSVSKPEKKSNH